MNAAQEARALTEWASIEAAQVAVKAAIKDLVLAQYRHNLTRGCDQMSAYRVMQRDMPDTIDQALTDANMAVQREMVATR